MMVYVVLPGYCSENNFFLLRCQCKVENQTDADFYVMTFNDADLIYTNHFSIIRVPAHQSVQVECLGGFSDR